MASADLTSFLASYTSQSMTGAAQWDTSADQSKTKAPVAASGAATAVATAVVNNPLPGVAGVGLTGPSSVVKFGSMAAPKDAQCTPITRMASEFEKATSGRLIAVNDNYISYSIKGNLIRVIHFVQVTRNKLAAHPAQVVDIEFAG